MLVGPSGCGKTTSLKMINRLIEPTSGRILIGGEDITRRDPTRLRRQIGYVVQGGGMMPHLSVAENVGLVPRLLKWDRRRIADRVDELLDLVGRVAALVVALARIALGVLVGQAAALRFHHALAAVVLRGDQLDVLFLALSFLLHCGKEFGVITSEVQITAEHGIPLKSAGRKK